MNLLEFYNRVSSADSKLRYAKFDEESIVFSLLNSSFRIADINNINISTGNKIDVEFMTEELASLAEDIFGSQIVPGIYNGPLYMMRTSRNMNSLAIELVKL
jgi:hypothetical protein